MCSPPRKRKDSTPHPSKRAANRRDTLTGKEPPSKANRKVKHKTAPGAKKDTPILESTPGKQPVGMGDVKAHNAIKRTCCSEEHCKGQVTFFARSDELMVECYMCRKWAHFPECYVGIELHNPFLDTEDECDVCIKCHTENKDRVPSWKHFLEEEMLLDPEPWFGQVLMSQPNH